MAEDGSAFELAYLDGKGKPKRRKFQSESEYLRWLNRHDDITVLAFADC